MPNWAYNKIYARTEEDFEKLKKQLLTNNQVDFNKIIPTPPSLEPDVIYEDSEWYKWRLTNWETEWNAYATIVDNIEMSIYFETAWSPAYQLIRTLTEQLGITLYMEYSEEQFSFVAGEVVFSNGKEFNKLERANSKDMYRIAAHMQDPCEEYHRYSRELGIIFDEEELDKYPTQEDLVSPMYKEFMGEELFYRACTLYENWSRNYDESISQSDYLGFCYENGISPEEVEGMIG